MNNCAGCGRTMALDAPYCPHCGKACGVRNYVPRSSPVKKDFKDGPVMKTFLVVAILFFSFVFWQIYGYYSSIVVPGAPPPATTAGK